jgi:hypothetical protein
MFEKGTPMLLPRDYFALVSHRLGIVCIYSGILSRDLMFERGTCILLPRDYFALVIT